MTTEKGQPDLEEGFSPALDLPIAWNAPLAPACPGGFVLVRRLFIRAAIAVPLAVAVAGHFWSPAYWAFAVVGPLVLLGIHDLVQSRHPLLRIYPVIGHGRYLMEELRPEIQQYFVESNTDGRPFDRESRSLIYQRAKGTTDTVPFGTQAEVMEPGFEWIGHSLEPAQPPASVRRVRIGGPDCRQPYDASRFNVSAMSFGSLSRNAILALNRAARAGHFAHNTGEGGISPHHLQEGGDLIWQIGTGYFGCRDAEGHFDPELFAEKAGLDAVKMIEIKLSQGAKPGHGGILPAAKLTEEIAAIRGVPLGQDVLSPPAHSAFEGPDGLLCFVEQLRRLSGGKPVGFKLCVGQRHEFLSIVKAMLETGIKPDFITVDGTEGGTGAAPLEFSNSVGMPLREGLSFVHNALVGAGLRRDIRILAAGKVATGFDLIRLLALGADAGNAARSMMLAMGCIQARRCNTNDCPVGIATQDPARREALDVAYASQRVQRFQERTLESFVELLGAAGLQDPSELRPAHIHRRLSRERTSTLATVYPSLAEAALLEPSGVPAQWREDWERAHPRHWSAPDRAAGVPEGGGRRGPHAEGIAEEPVLV